MKTTLYTTILLFVFMGNISHAQYSLEYVPQFGMYLNQVCANGGPMYQSIKRRLDSIDHRRNIKEQSVPIITRDEIRALQREYQVIIQLESNALSQQYYYQNMRNYDMCRRYISVRYEIKKVGARYQILFGQLEQFSILRPDAIR